MIGPEAAPAVIVCPAVAKVNSVATLETTVSVCVAEVRPPAAAVIVGEPALVSS